MNNNRRFLLDIVHGKADETPRIETRTENGAPRYVVVVPNVAGTKPLLCDCTDLDAANNILAIVNGE